MSRFASGISLATVVVACLISSACSNSNSGTTVTPDQVPASVDLCLAPTTTCAGGLNVSLEVGQFQALTATGLNPVAQVLTETFSYQSSNPAVLTISTNGAACAGTWDSLTTPTTCTPGLTGTAEVTATALGVSSPPVTIYVHQHITRVSISKVPNQPPTLSNLCYSKGAPSGPESALYEAFAFNGNADITASVGPFAWQTVSVTGQTTSAVTLSAPPVGTPLNQEIATANSPGITPFFAVVGGFHSQPMQFETCPVQSISLAALGNPATSFVVNTGTTTTLNATVIDTLGMKLVGVPLSWTTSNPISLFASGTTSTIYGSVGTVSASAVGAGAVIASCTPPSCNGGFAPSLPIYPTTAISFTVKSTSAPTSPTVYVSSTGCSVTTTALCGTTVVPITGSNGSFAAGTPVSLPFTPNSFQFDSRGGNAYLGVDSSSFGTNGLMVFTGSSVSPVRVAGKVLAASSNVTLANSQPTSLVILSDTVDVPNQVFIYDTGSQTASSFLMDNAVAAAFSPDGLKAYIVSGTRCPGAASGGCLLVYSTVDAAQMVPLTSPATDVAFVGNGSFGYLAGGDPAGASFLPTCFDPSLSGSLGSVPLPASQFIRPLPDGQAALALAPPNVQPVTATISGIPLTGVDGCPAPRGFLSVTNTPGPMFNLGVGKFTPTEFMISSDGSAAYILGEIPQPSPNPPLRFPFVIVFNLATQSASNISLAGNAVPLSASLSPAGDLLFVGADDGAVHVINTATFADTDQITFPFPQTALCFGPGTPSTAPPVTCLPDLVAAHP
jgi:hypothetical protein